MRISLTVSKDTLPSAANVIFVSTSSTGTPGELNQLVLKQIGEKASPNRDNLKKVGFHISELISGALLVWVVTVDSSQSTASLLGENLRAAMRALLLYADKLSPETRIWMPLMGTGVGRLKDLESAKLTLDTLEDFGLENSDLKLIVNATLALPPETDETFLERISQDAKRINQFRKSTAGINEGEQDSRKNANGSEFSFNRETDGELALGREQLALALARLFRVAQGEFSLALLGRWGSGKTTVAKEVTEYLCDQSRYQADFGSVFRNGVRDEQNIEYEAVNFNAWRYRNRPELWIWLYESFVLSFLNCSFGARVLRTIRAGVEKHGFWEALFTLVLLAFSAFPFMWLSFVLPSAAAVFGIFGLLGLLFLGRRWQKSLRSLVDKYGLITTHREKLGMQALVGEDLRLLVRAWTHKQQFEKWQKYLLGSIILAVGLPWFVSIYQGNESWLREVMSQLGEFSGLNTASFSTGLSPMLVSAIAWLTWCVISVTFFIAIATDAARTDRVLLVVDDLDRCPQEEIVDLIDGIKLMIDDEDVGDVVQALVLADDLILEAAIRHRFEEPDSVSTGSVSDKNNSRAAVREHMEKVFLCHLSLPTLSASDLTSLVTAFGKEFGIRNEIYSDSHVSMHHDTITSPEPVSYEDKRKTWFQRVVTAIPVLQSEQPATLDEQGQEPDISQQNNNVPSQDREEEPTVEMSTVLSQIEFTAIQDALQKIHSVKVSGNNLTPRSIRSFFFKYQLARMLLLSHGVNFETNDLVDELTNAVRNVRSDREESDDIDISANDVMWAVGFVT